MRYLVNKSPLKYKTSMETIVKMYWKIVKRPKNGHRCEYTHMYTSLGLGVILAMTDVTVSPRMTTAYIKGLQSNTEDWMEGLPGS